MPATGDFRDPNWEPTDQEHNALMEDFRRMVLWRKAMAAKGIKILSMKMTPTEETAAMRAWWSEEGQTLNQAEVAR